LRNRKCIGLVFAVAVAMAWRGLFILSTFYRDYYFAQDCHFRDKLEGSMGHFSGRYGDYILLICLQEGQPNAVEVAPEGRRLFSLDQGL
jgi:hypothetical protein